MRFLAIVYSIQFGKNDERSSWKNYKLATVSKTLQKYTIIADGHLETIYS